MKASKFGFYEYLGRKKPNAQIEREALEGFVVEAFERHKGRYGVSVNIVFTIFANVFSPIAPTRFRRIRQRGCAAFGA